MDSIYEHVGGETAIRKYVEVFYASVLADPLLQPLFGAGRPSHVDHLTAVLSEVFGGPTRYTDELGGFASLLDAHRGLKINEGQRQRFAELLVAAADAAGLPDDERFRTALAGYADFGTDVARQNSHATSDGDLHPCQEIPRWPW